MRFCRLLTPTQIHAKNRPEYQKEYQKTIEVLSRKCIIGGVTPILAQAADSSGAIGGLVLIGICIGLYFLPAIIAGMRGHRNEAEAKERERMNNVSKAKLPDSEKGQARDKAAKACDGGFSSELLFGLDAHRVGRCFDLVGLQGPGLVLAPAKVSADALNVLLAVGHAIVERGHQPRGVQKQQSSGAFEYRGRVMPSREKSARLSSAPLFLYQHEESSEGREGGKR